MLNLFPRLTDDVNFDLFDDVFDAPVFHHDLLMKTDVTEENGRYVMKMDLPGYRKEDIQISLHNGNLKIRANTNRNNEEKDDKGRIVRQERFDGSCERTFYVGDDVKEDEVHASFDNGTLTIDVPSKNEHPEIDTRKYIAIQ